MRPKGQKNPSLVQSSFYFKNDTQNKKKTSKELDYLMYRGILVFK